MYRLHLFSLYFYQFRQYTVKCYLKQNKKRKAEDFKRNAFLLKNMFIRAGTTSLTIISKCHRQEPVNETSIILQLQDNMWPKTISMCPTANIWMNNITVKPSQTQSSTRENLYSQCLANTWFSQIRVDAEHTMCKWHYSRSSIWKYLHNEVWLELKSNQTEEYKSGFSLALWVSTKDFKAMKTISTWCGSLHINNPSQHWSVWGWLGW